MAARWSSENPVPSVSPYLAVTPEGGLSWGPLIEGRLIRRYKRFLADVELADGEVVTAHTANTGAMLGCCQPGRPVWLSHHDSPTRKLKYTLEMIDMPSALVGVNTGVPNRLVRAAVMAGRIAELPPPSRALAEVRIGASRLDLLLEYDDNRPSVYVEIKNCSLVEEGVALFPDAVTTRGTKHLGELAEIAHGGGRAVIFVLAQRGDAEKFAPADHIDPEWGRTLRRVVRDGVELFVYRTCLTTAGVSVGQRLPVIL